ncbi:hypothetical protein Tco_0706153 [Tanacetum coccineum]|uniref:Uncharacterized protein n=1 Tax=Tanacetum coccineum TaxID=301880 RepID=A0ABQ4Y855_9ASTR
MLCKPKSFYDEKNKVAIGYKNPLCLTRAKQAQSALYNGHVLVTTNHTPTIIHDSEDTREIAEITRKRMLLKMQSPLVNASTEASVSKPRSNTKKNRIMPAKENIGYQWRPTWKETSLRKNMNVVNNRDPEGNALYLDSGYSKHRRNSFQAHEFVWKSFTGSVRFRDDHLELYGLVEIIMVTVLPSKAYFA